MSKNTMLIGGLVLGLLVGAGGTHLYTSAISNNGGLGSIATAPASGDTSNVVATVNGVDVTENMVQARKEFIAIRTGALFQQLPPAEQNRVVKENLILEVLVDQNMVGSNIASDPEVMKQLKDSRAQILRTAYLDEVAAQAITEEALRQNYDTQIAALPDLEEVRARHILVADKGVAQDLIDQIEAGDKTFEELAATNSLDKANAEQGGDLGYFTQNQMVPEFAKVVFEMETGALTSEPAQTGFGWHVIRVDDKRMKAKPTFEQVREGLENEERQKVIKEIIERWRSEADITDHTAPTNTEPASEAQPTE